MKSWFSSTFAQVMITVMITVVRGRPMPLKNPSTPHTATPSGAPATRGTQKRAAVSSMCWLMPKGARM